MREKVVLEMFGDVFNLRVFHMIQSLHEWRMIKVPHRVQRIMHLQVRRLYQVHFDQSWSERRLAESRTEKVRLILKIADLNHVDESAQHNVSSQDVQSDQDVDNGRHPRHEAKGLEHDVVVQIDEPNGGTQSYGKVQTFRFYHVVVVNVTQLV